MVASGMGGTLSVTVHGLAARPVARRKVEFGLPPGND